MNYIAKYPQSAMLYMLILLISMLFIYFASRRKYIDKKINIWLWAAIILLSVFAGIRGENIGVDVEHYIRLFIEPIRDGQFQNLSSDMSIGFKCLVWLVFRFTDQTWVVFLVIALITNALIIMRLWDFRHIASPRMIFFIYYCFYYLITFNIFRQFIAVAIVFYFSRYLEQKRYKLFCLSVIVATAIHEVSILGFILLPIYILMVEDQDSRGKKTKKILLALTPVIVVAATVVLYRYFDFDHYINLLNRSSNRGSRGIAIPVKIVLGLSMFYIVGRYSSSEIPKTELKKFFLIYAVGLIFGLSSYLSYEAERFTYYFLMFEPICISLKTKRTKTTELMRVIYILFALYTMYSRLSSNGLQIMPYETFYS